VNAAAVLLDLDGTLTDNYEGIAASIRHALDRMGVHDPGAAALRGCVGPPLRESFARLLATADRAVIEEAIAHYRERYRDAGWRENVVYAGVPEALAALAACDVRLFLCTSKPEVFARRIVAHFGLDAHLSGVYGADLAGRFDDKSVLLAHLLATEGVDSARAIMVGDRAQDVRAAHGNGARSIGVLWGYGSRAELVHAGADALIPAPGELCAAAQAFD
jgi:phosphoglycolate phosphatase